MRATNIDLAGMFGHDPMIPAAAERETWFIENTQPHTSPNAVEDMLNRIVRPIQSRLEGNAKPNLRALPQF